MRIRIGTRGSELAMWQARHVAHALDRVRTDIVVIKTRGDKIQNVSFNKMEGKGFFTKELEEALLDKKIDIAVHSLKDLPTDETEGLKIGAVLKRDDPSDVLLIRENDYFEGMFPPVRKDAIIGTSSLRRSAQIRYLAPEIKVEPLRGNITTRIQKLREGLYNAIILASAGVLRLSPDLKGLKIFNLSTASFLPAPAQGVLAIQIREKETDIERAVSFLNHRETEITVNAERSFLSHFGGGCQVPLGALAVLQDGIIKLDGMVAEIDGSMLCRQSVEGREPAELGKRLAGLIKKENT